MGAVIVAAATPSKRFKDWRRVIMPGLSRQFVSILGSVDRKTSFLKLWVGQDNARFA